MNTKTKKMKNNNNNNKKKKKQEKKEEKEEKKGIILFKLFRASGEAILGAQRYFVRLF